ncbi:hypothetical protein HMI54_000797 [Coelomomyces lativittatus]|nr:hypothetical protein HMI56_004931 [Coelomomyces lativittatus]KAJ1501906.1 hypothetical protein HMI55_003161 [Coelomomyces lativittatus]KAJ1511464.1 hypothetical protein HMI54_000797 [Coelomomyces lativittatus]
MPFRFFPRSHSQSQIEPEYVDLKEIKGEKLVKRLEDRTESERTLHVSSQEQLKSIHESLWHTHQTQSSLSDSTTVMKDDLTLSLEGLNLDFSKKSPKKNLLMRFLKKDIKPIKKDLPVRPSAVLTSEQKMALALEERDLRLKEVISVLENRRPMPKRLEHMKIHNFLGDGTYGFVLTSFLGKKEVL